MRTTFNQSINQPINPSIHPSINHYGTSLRPAPMHMRGPSPNGMKAVGWRAATSSSSRNRSGLDNRGHEERGMRCEMECACRGKW